MEIGILLSSVEEGILFIRKQAVRTTNKSINKNTDLMHDTLLNVQGSEQFLIGIRYEITQSSFFNND